MHFFSPCERHEAVGNRARQGYGTGCLATAMGGRRARSNKVPVVVGVCHGFVGNRMLSARGSRPRELLLEGALPQDVDGALTEFLPVGPFAMGDLAGIDVGWRSRKERGGATRSPTLWRNRAASGRRPARASISTTAGREPDPEVEKLIVDASVRMGVKRRSVSKEEIIERLVYPMVNEGAPSSRKPSRRVRATSMCVALWLRISGLAPAGRCTGPIPSGLARSATGLKRLRRKRRQAHERAALLNKLADESGTFAGYATVKAARIGRTLRSFRAAGIQGQELRKN